MEALVPAGTPSPGPGYLPPVLACHAAPARTATVGDASNDSSESNKHAG